MINRAEFRRAFRIFLEETTTYRKTQYYRFFLVEVSTSSASSNFSNLLTFSSSSTLDASKISKQQILSANKFSDEHRSVSSTLASSTLVTFVEKIIYSRSIESEVIKDRVNSATQVIITTAMKQTSTRFTQ